MIAMPDTRLLTLQEAGDILGISKYTVKEYILRGKLEGVRVGVSWRVHPDALEAYIVRNTTQLPNQQAPNEGNK